MDQRESPTPVKAKGSGGSIVRKITLRQTVRTIGLFFWINALIVLLFWGCVWFGVEKTAQKMAPSSASSGIVREQMNDFFTVTTYQGELADKFVHNQIVERMDILPGVRGLRADTNGLPWWEAPSRWSWVITTPAGEGSLAEITFTLGSIWTSFYNCFCVLLFFETACVISGLFKVSRSVRNTLLPISLLTLATHQSMSAQQPPRPSVELQLGSTIDTLNAITENRLDTRIDVGREREELRGLAMAINSMLDRVDFAYRSQLRFVSDASHELRTPISVIQGYANLLDRWGKEDPKTLEESITAIKHEAEQMKELVEHLLFLARSDNNSIALNMEWVDLSELVQDVAKESEMIDQTHKIRCLERPALHMMADPSLLKQSLRILMDNAIKYTPEDGYVTLDVTKQDDMAALSVTDSGVGIGAEDLPKLFDRFYRTDSSRTRQTGGAGLGLSIAKWIVDSHGGVIEVLSREGIGTRMTIKLPLKPDNNVSLVASVIPDLKYFEQS